MSRLLNIAALSVLLTVALIGCKSAGVSVGHSNGPSPGARNGPPSHAPAHGYRKKHQYHYYADREVYYSPSRGTYFWLEGEKWRLGVQLPHHIALNLGDHVAIELDSDTPYGHHDSVATKHPGQGKGKGKGRGKGKGDRQGRGRAHN